MLIECVIRRADGTKVPLGDANYHFAPYSKDDPRHVAEVADPEHIQTFLAIKEAYRIVNPAPVESAQIVPIKPKRGRPALIRDE